MADSDSSEKYLTLPDGRILGYAEQGSTSSSILVLFFHGVFGVGSASRPLPPVLREKNVHSVVPTLAGWGNSSPRPSHSSYLSCLTSDVTALVNHLHPDDSNLTIYIGGGTFSFIVNYHHLPDCYWPGSYGTVPVQVLYGAPFDIFPLGRRIAGCFLMAPFSPFKWHKDYTKFMTWTNYIGVGPPSRLIPFRLLPRMAVLALRTKFKSVDQAEIFIRAHLFDHTSDEERACFAKWREEQGLSEGEFEHEMAKNVVCSVGKTWEGFLEVSDVLHADWGFRPDQLDEEHTRRPLLIVASTEDDLGQGMANWLSENYKNSRLRWVNGGHLSSLYEIESIWAEVLEREGPPVDTSSNR